MRPISTSLITYMGRFEHDWSSVEQGIPRYRPGLLEWAIVHFLPSTWCGRREPEPARCTIGMSSLELYLLDSLPLGLVGLHQQLVGGYL
jgi:hypothetical protein